jgi:hypothetical protein
MVREALAALLAPSAALFVAGYTGRHCGLRRWVRGETAGSDGVLHALGVF